MRGDEGTIFLLSLFILVFPLLFSLSFLLCVKEMICSCPLDSPWQRQGRLENQQKVETGHRRFHGGGAEGKQVSTADFVLRQ